MTQVIHKLANADTPATVSVPNDKYSLILWAVGRFGGSAIVCAVCFWALSKVYDDQKETSSRMLTMLEQRAVSDARLAEALTNLTDMVENVRKDAQNAHNALNR